MSKRKLKSYEDDRNLNITDIENIMSVYKDKRDNYRYNLNETIYFDNINTLNTYTTKTETHWSLIAYELYKTIRLAWLLMKVNGVKGEDIFKPISAATEIKYPSQDQVSQIIEYILA